MEEENNITNQIDDELDELLGEFQNMDISVPEETKQSIAPLQDLTKSEDLEKFVTTNTQDLVQTGMGAVKNLMQDAQASGDPESITSVSQFAKAITSSLELLNKQVIKNKELKNKIELENLKRDQSIKEGLDDVKGFISDRENAFKSILNDLQEEEKLKDSDSYIDIGEED